MKGGKNPKKVYLGLQHLSGGSYSSFKFSPSLNGLLCVTCVLFANEIGIAYRGRRDDGDVSLETNDELIKADENFKALLAYRVDAGDKVLEHHLKILGKNATYISKTVQNELIDICGQIITEKIIKEAKIAKYFLVIADETTDVSHHEQLCVCIRFVCLINGFHTIREEFLNFKKANDLSGKGLGELIIQTLKGHCLNLTYLVGQGYDGASAMSGCYNGVQEHVRMVAPSAVFVHCRSHVLNLVLNSTYSVPEIRDMFSTVKKCTTFVNDSIKRRKILEKFFQDSESSVSCLKSFSETRFVERHDCLLIFYQNFINIVKCLEEIVHKLESKTADTARSLLRCLYDLVVIVALFCA
ncbi:52 kDa repressor of the inhibitor of the protein kinase-like [Hydra vulgaris]|uniref:52 kDa repressor of the inhibitor of the protein kinase-like n=1 Tax=Hydra vulgaris TaxID=6087 RepID=A0ABM4DBB4_HYDVU